MGRAKQNPNQTRETTSLTGIRACTHFSFKTRQEEEEAGDQEGDECDGDGDDSVKKEPLRATNSTSTLVTLSAFYCISGAFASRLRPGAIKVHHS